MSACRRLRWWAAGCPPRRRWFCQQQRHLCTIHEVKIRCGCGFCAGYGVTVAMKPLVLRSGDERNAHHSWTMRTSRQGDFCVYTPVITGNAVTLEKPRSWATKAAAPVPSALAPWRVGSLRGIGQLQSVLGAQSRCQCCNGDRHLLYPTPVQGFSKMFRQRGVAGFVWAAQHLGQSDGAQRDAKGSLDCHFEQACKSVRHLRAWFSRQVHSAVSTKNLPSVGRLTGRPRWWPRRPWTWCERHRR